jgi:lipopolysaccharide transport system ATP-binding protein
MIERVPLDTRFVVHCPLYIVGASISDIAIRVENLSKRYRIGARQKRANALRATLGNLAASPFDYLRRTLRGPTEKEIIWVLKDVSFEVQRGEVVGIPSTAL